MPTPALPATTQARAYFIQDGRLVAEQLEVSGEHPARSSMEALLAGPRVAGHQTQVPAGTRLLGLSVTGGTATLDLSDHVRHVQGIPAIPLLLGQVVFTLTQFPNVQRVVVRVAGEEVRVLGGEGVTVPEPLDRATVQRLLR